MKHKAHSIIIETDVTLQAIDRSKELYSNATAVYGFSPHEHSRNKFHHIYNKLFFMRAANEYARYICHELKELQKSNIIHEIALLNYFVPHSDNPIFIFFLARKIRDLNPNSRITIVTSNKTLYALKSIPGFVELENIELLYDSPLIKTTLVPANKMQFVVINVCYIFVLLSRVLWFKLLYGTRSPRKNAFLFFSAGFKWWERQDNGQMLDFYYANSIRKLSSISQFHVLCLTFDISFSKELAKHSAFNYMDLKAILRGFIRSLMHFFKVSKHLSPQWIVNETKLLKNIFDSILLKSLFKITKPKSVVYYDEVYVLGRYISLATDELGIDSYGFQHALESSTNIVYKSLELQRDMPELYPKFLLVYGAYSNKLFTKYGFPNDKIFQIGFDRITSEQKTLKPKRHDHKIKVMFIGGNDWMNHLFDILYLKRKQFPIKSLQFKPHPLFAPDKNKFATLYPEALLLDKQSSALIKHIEKVDCVIGSFSTALVNAIHLKKTVVAWLPYELEDLYALAHWGVQIVHSLEQIDWRRKPNPDKLIHEITPKIDIVKLFRDKYL